MWSNGFGNAASMVSLLASMLHRIGADVASGNVARKKPRLGPFKSPPLTDNFQQLGGEHHVAILLPLTLLNANHHPSTVNVANLESNGFRDPQPRAIATR